jgi:hypothetical protein
LFHSRIIRILTMGNQKAYFEVARLALLSITPFLRP